MLILKRKEGQWVELTHRSGDVIRVLLRDIRLGDHPHAAIVFDDPDRNFEIERPERKHQREGS